MTMKMMSKCQDNRKDNNLKQNMKHLVQHLNLKAKLFACRYIQAKEIPAAYHGLIMTIYRILLLPDIRDPRIRLQKSNIARMLEDFTIEQVVHPLQEQAKQKLLNLT